ncbi:MAG TPA: lysozyme [Ignavibacteriales bacterium]|nr:lysozyme [Ignavibacteriales bacterium]
MRTNKAGISIIKTFESLHDGDLKMIGLQPKMCPAGIWTEGYGHAMTYNGKFLKGIENKDLAYKLHTVNNEQDAERLLQEDLRRVESEVSRQVRVALNENMFSALVSFTFNLGEHNLATSTLLKYLNAGKLNEAADEFVRWNKCNGEELDGLTKRRLSEKALFVSRMA